MRLIIELTKYMMILLIGLYTHYSFQAIRHKDSKRQNQLYVKMSVIIFVLHFVAYFTLYLQIRTDRLLLLYAFQVLLFLLVLALYQVCYSKLSKYLLMNMLMLLSIGFVVLTRLSYDKAMKQVGVTAIAFLLCLIVPYAVKAATWIRHLGWFFGITAIVLLLIVLFFGTTNYGATNWIYIGRLSVQPSEVVKLLFVFSIAALFCEGTGLKRVCIVTVMAGINVLILVLQRDLGGALIFFVTYVFMLYIATERPLYLFAGLSGGSVAAYIAYHIFDHVKVRVIAWQNPWRYIDREGYQISQSLFAIGTGGWLGLGLNQGLPTSIPVVDSDFIFSAISEEFGGLFALCILLIYTGCFVIMINISLEQEDTFYRLLSLGFSVMFGFQVILSIGGVIKFIPSTGVTLPLISYGGSSIFATVLTFMVLQGVYMISKTGKKETEHKTADRMEEL